METTPTVLLENERRALWVALGALAAREGEDVPGALLKVGAALVLTTTPPVDVDAQRLASHLLMELVRKLEATPAPPGVEVCRRCERHACKHFRGGRSEAAYIDCLEHTAARADEHRRGIKRIHETNPDWASVFMWMDEHKDTLVKKLSDENGELTYELTVARDRLAATERDLERAVREGL